MKFNFFYFVGGIYLGIAIVSFIPWVQVGIKITAYSSIIALFITIYESSKVSFEIAKAGEDLKKQKRHYIYMLVMKVLTILSPFVLLYWISHENDESVLSKISNYVTFAAIGVVFLTRGMELKNQPK